MTLQSVDAIAGEIQEDLIDTKETAGGGIWPPLEEEDADGSEEDSEENTDGEEPSVEDIVAVSIEALKNIDGKDILAAIETYAAIDEERKILNNRKAEVKEELEGKGFPRQALDALYARYKKDPRVRAKIDPAFAKGCQVLDLDLQGSLFPAN